MLLVSLSLPLHCLELFTEKGITVTVLTSCVQDQFKIPGCPCMRT